MSVTHAAQVRSQSNTGGFRSVGFLEDLRRANVALTRVLFSPLLLQLRCPAVAHFHLRGGMWRASFVRIDRLEFGMHEQTDLVELCVNTV